MDEIILPVLTALIASLLGGGATGLIEKYIRSKKKAVAPTPTEKLNTALEKLRITASEMDSVISEVASDITKRHEALTELQLRSEELASQEAELKKKINHLQNIPVEVARYFQEINEANLSAMDKKSSKRDLQFFILGVLVSVLTAIILKQFGI